MRQLFVTVLVAAAFVLGIYVGRKPEAAVLVPPAEAVQAEIVRGHALAETALEAPPALAEVRAENNSPAAALPEDMFVRLKNEAEEKTAAQAEQEPRADEKPQERPKKADPAVTAHMEAGRALAAFANADYHYAAQRFEAAFSLKPEQAFLNHLLLSLLLIGEADRAAALLSEHSEYTDEDELAGIIEIAVRKGRAFDALKLFNSETKSPRLLHSAGLAHEAAGDFEGAYELYERAYALEQANPVFTFSMARTADMKGDYSNALLLYEKTAAKAEAAELKSLAVARIAVLREHFSSLSR